MKKIIITPSKACKKYKPIDVEEFKSNITKERAYFLGSRIIHHLIKLHLTNTRH